jgi:O-antigen/teichoic acid export membrane protein
VKTSLTRAVISRLFTSACSVITAFVSLKLYNIYLTKEIYGVILIGVQIMSYLPLTGGGFIEVLNQRTLTARDKESSTATVWFAQLLQNYLMLATLAIALVLMAAYSQMPLVKSSGISGLLFLAVGVAGTFAFYMSGQMSFLIGQGEQINCYLFQGTSALLASLLLYISFACGAGAWAFPISTGGTALLLFPPVRNVLRHHLVGLPLFVLRRSSDFFDRLKSIWRPAFACLMTQGWSLLAFSLDIILVGMLVGPGAAAVYGVISRVTGMSRHVLQALGEASWPRLAQEAHPERKALFMRKVDRLNAWNVGCWFGALGATVHPFLEWLVKTDWVAGPLLIALILVRHFVISLAGPHAFGNISLGLFKESARLSRMEVISLTIPALLLSHSLGAIGIALGFLIGTCWVSGWQITRLYFNSTGQSWVAEWCAVYARGLTGAFLAFALASTVWKLASTLGNFPGWLAILAGGIGFGGGWMVTAGTSLWRSRYQQTREF